MSDIVQNVEKVVEDVAKAMVDYNCNINNNGFKLLIPEGTQYADAISACLTFLEHFKGLYVAAIDKHKDQILQPLQKPTEIVQPELVEPPTHA